MFRLRAMSCSRSIRIGFGRLVSGFVAGAIAIGCAIVLIFVSSRPSGIEPWIAHLAYVCAAVTIESGSGP